MDSAALGFFAGLITGGIGMLCIISFIGGIHVNVEVRSDEEGTGNAEHT